MLAGSWFRSRAGSQAQLLCVGCVVQGVGLTTAPNTCPYMRKDSVIKQEKQISHAVTRQVLKARTTVGAITLQPFPEDLGWSLGSITDRCVAL